ncbi:MAG TPA: TonB-dependent receptor [Solimonas sp.]|nr:TonB-dependent receptor [Solimonas sp.]
MTELQRAVHIPEGLFMIKLCSRCLWVLLWLTSLELRAQSEQPPPVAEAAPVAEPAGTTAEDEDTLQSLLDDFDSTPQEEGAAPEPADAAGDTPAEAPVQQDVAAPAAAEELPVIRLQEKQAAAPVLKEAAPRSPQLEEIVVTATKRSQVARDIPSSMSVQSGEKLEQLGIRKVKDIFTLIPGVNLQDEIAGQQRKISVRGVGPDTGTNQTVGTVLGDVPISDPYGATTIVDPNPWDMRTVEVLKGPQGSLFGATSLAGLIRYVPNAPELEVWKGKAFYDYTTVDRGGSAPAFGGALNVPVGDSVALRLAGIYQNSPGVIDSDNPSRREEDVDSAHSWSGRAMALWQPSEELSINAMYLKDRRVSDDINIVTFPEPSYSREDAPQASPSANGFTLATLDIRYAFDWATLASISGYQEKNSYNDIDTSYLAQPIAQAGVSFLHAQRQVDTHGLMQELRLTSPDDGDLTWLGGVYFSSFSQAIVSDLYLEGTSILGPLAALLPPPLSGLISENGVSLARAGYDPLEANELAIYGEANYDFSDSLRLTLGSRLYKTTVEGTFKSSGASSGNNGKNTGTTEKGWSPKIAITWRPWDDIMFYGNISRGFQFGGFNLPTISTGQTPLTFESSSLWNYEIGARTDWFDRTLRLDITAFFLDWTNPQVRQVGPGGLSAYVDNVGATHNIGVEGTLSWATPIEGLIIEQTGSYIEARTSEPFQDVSGEEIPEGTLMPSAPRVQAVTTLSYSRPFGPWLTQASLINSFQDTAFTSIDHSTEVGGYNLLGFTFNLTRNDLSWTPSITLSVNNIMNEQKLAAGFGPAGGDVGPLGRIVADSSYVYTQPRSIILRGAIEF